MSRSQAQQPCYPEPGQPEGCFPDNDRTPSPFECWLADVSDQLGSPGRAPAEAKRPSRPAPAQGRLRSGR